MTKPDFFTGWEDNVLQKAISGCTCNPYGDPTCCANAGIFTFNQTAQCYISNTVDETVLGTLSILPGANPVQAPCYENYIASYTPAVLAPIYTYTATTGTGLLPTGTIATPTTMIQVVQTAAGTCIRKGAAIRSWDVSINLLICVGLAHLIWAFS